MKTQFLQAPLTGIFLLVCCSSLSAQQDQAPAQSPAPKLASEASLSILRERAAALRKNQAAFLQGVKDGTIDPHAHLREKWPELTAKVAQLQEIQSQITAQEGDVEALSRQLYAGLQEIGPYLRDGSVPDSVALKKQVYTDEQVQTINSLTKRIYSPVASKEEIEEHLRIVGPQDRFTVLFLSIPITISAPPKATVFFECEMGGHFVSNGLPVKEAVADEAGLVHVQWISTGDSSGEAYLTVSSPQAANSLLIPIRTVDLKLLIPSNFIP